MTDFHPGQRIRHDFYGAGVVAYVTTIIGGRAVVCRFDPVELRGGGAITVDRVELSPEEIRPEHPPVAP